MTHHTAKSALVAVVMSVALAAPTAAAAASGEPLIVPNSSAEHRSPHFMTAPAWSSEHNAAGSSTALIVPGTSTEHGSVGNGAVVATGSRSSYFQDGWASLGAAGLLLAVVIATAMAIRFEIRGRGATA